LQNKKGTPLTLGVSPHGLQLYRFNQTATQPIVRFSWAECAELSYQEVCVCVRRLSSFAATLTEARLYAPVLQKRFTVVCHDSGTRPFSIFTQRSRTCLQILYLCVGLHHLCAPRVLWCAVA
jgi:hypothetical protein